jgi:uncharacterized membrane protein HdeD (DUF308 family)
LHNLRFYAKFEIQRIGIICVTTREIEAIKHRASWLNSLGTAAISGGIVAPLVAISTSFALTVASIGAVLLLSGIALCAGFALHETGAKFIDEITV